MRSEDYSTCSFAANHAAEKVSINLHLSASRFLCHFATHQIHHGAMDIHPVLDAALDAPFPSLAGWKMASRPSSRSRTGAQRVSTVTESREIDTAALRATSAANHCAHFPI